MAANYTASAAASTVLDIAAAAAAIPTAGWQRSPGSDGSRSQIASCWSPHQAGPFPNVPCQYLPASVVSVGRLAWEKRRASINRFPLFCVVDLRILRNVFAVSARGRSGAGSHVPSFRTNTFIHLLRQSSKRAKLLPSVFKFTECFNAPPQNSAH
ncbi:hypothetical protein E2C01_012032 [Portunus trituberculatus]|uniref:Uncharacterized protein n=1 Tax=Portunus trituberculatus TaxID=210409 RepID=A0A5B7DCU9_PORTR|nr:hypothetical protein [Portunus trituberculatus]